MLDISCDETSLYKIATGIHCSTYQIPEQLSYQETTSAQHKSFGSHQTMKVCKQWWLELTSLQSPRVFIWHGSHTTSLTPTQVVRINHQPPTVATNPGSKREYVFSQNETTKKMAKISFCIGCLIQKYTNIDYIDKYQIYILYRILRLYTFWTNLIFFCILLNYFEQHRSSPFAPSGWSASLTPPMSRDV